jgi:hypothetical protein
MRGGVAGLMKSIPSLSIPRQSDAGPSTIKTLGTMFAYGISAILIGPLYLLAEFLNIPMNNLNNLSRKAFNDKKDHSFLHVPIHKMITGCKIKNLEPDNFVLQDDMHIHNNVAVVSCDKEGANTHEVPAYSTSMADSFMDFFGLIPRENKLRHHVFSLFQYIENIRETDEGRKVHIQKLMAKVSDYKVLLKCYIIYRSISSVCPNIKRKTKTVLKDEDVINIVNPYYIPGHGHVSYTKRIGCIYKHLTKKRFDPQEKEDCKIACDTCTFQNSLSRLASKYASIVSVGGCRVSMVKKMITTYYTFLRVTKTTTTLPTDEKGVVKYLDGLNVKSELNGDTKNEKVVLEKFNTFMCKYNIIDILKELIEKRIKEKLEAGYTMESILRSVETK